MKRVIIINLGINLTLGQWFAVAKPFCFITEVIHCEGGVVCWHLAISRGN
jgi:hypothetical protein